MFNFLLGVGVGLKILWLKLYNWLESVRSFYWLNFFQIFLCSKNLFAKYLSSMVLSLWYSITAAKKAVFQLCSK